MSLPGLIYPIRTAHALMALCLAASLVWIFPAFAGTLPEVQRLMKQGQYPKALEQVDAFLAARPKDAQGRFYKGLILTELNRLGEAVTVFSRLTEDYPKLPEPYNNLAVLYARQQDYDRARLALEKAIRTHPAYTVAHENLGDIYARLASQAYSKALQLDSGNAAAQNKLALIDDFVSLPGALFPTTASATAVAPTPPSPATVIAASPGVTATPAIVKSPPPAATQSPPVAVQPTLVTPPPAVVKTTPDKPPTPLESVAPPARNAEREIGAMVRAWADAWARQEVREYLSHYAPAFKTPNGMSRKAWESERKARVSRPSWIKVSLANLRVTVNGDRARVEMRQSYRASNFRSDSSKALLLVFSGNRWRILEENAR